MMRTRGLLVIGLLAAASAWWLWPSDAERIRRVCRDLAEVVSIPAAEADIARITRVARLSALLHPDLFVQFEQEDVRLDGRDQVAGFAARVRPARGLTVSLGDIEVSVEADGARAVATTTATAREPGVDGGPDTVDVRVLALTFVKGDAWQLADATVRDPGFPR